ncbi:hypothetical protein DICPUDRAFT_158009 [Dictyostelium purpureum]|uniref:Uncharacterized protein n=1 Tax=Dictyostelium purpureum TaxID=5786 RepID=F1A0K8_DICPU|nr:uncharacterized protein DICPUDRAFT_158009 [Dictyostelium purpureum]EGC30277.1 hypothetical protein DICPUDRAFT_158009 [Dictyostelium purpureum]|eukprot:XP_003293204.1 hypothetical protein DICPUDRAFT_158009 [Dictyostelium purpureum]
MTVDFILNQPMEPLKKFDGIFSDVCFNQRTKEFYYTYLDTLNSETQRLRSFLNSSNSSLSSSSSSIDSLISACQEFEKNI